MVVRLEDILAFVVSVMRVNLLKDVVGLVVEMVDVVISEVSIDIVAIFVYVYVERVDAENFDKIVDV